MVMLIFRLGTRRDSFGNSSPAPSNEDVFRSIMSQSSLTREDEPKDTWAQGLGNHSALPKRRTSAPSQINAPATGSESQTAIEGKLNSVERSAGGSHEDMGEDAVSECSPGDEIDGMVE
jgi:hypothetical protein